MREHWVETDNQTKVFTIRIQSLDEFLTIARVFSVRRAQDVKVITRSAINNLNIARQNWELNK